MCECVRCQVLRARVRRKAFSRCGRPRPLRLGTSWKLSGESGVARSSSLVHSSSGLVHRHVEQIDRQQNPGAGGAAAHRTWTPSASQPTRYFAPPFERTIIARTQTRRAHLCDRSPAPSPSAPAAIRFSFDARLTLFAIVFLDFLTVKFHDELCIIFANLRR